MRNYDHVNEIVQVIYRWAFAVATALCPWPAGRSAIWTNNLY